MAKSKNVAAPAASAPAAPVLYTLNDKALAMSGAQASNTLQGILPKGNGKDWRQNSATQAPNTRVLALAHLVAQVGDTFTAEQFLTSMAEHKKTATGTWTPASRFKAFVKSGYVVPKA